MTTFGTISLDPATNTARLSAIRWRLVLACALMLTSFMLAALLSRVPVPADDSEGIRGTVQWMVTRWGWWFGVPILWWIAGLSAVGAVAAGLATLGRGGWPAWAAMLSSGVSLLGVGIWYILGVAWLGNAEFLRGPWYLAALAGGSVAAILLLASVPIPHVLARLGVPCAPGGVTLSRKVVINSAAGGLVLLAIVLAGPVLGTLPDDAAMLALKAKLRRTQMLHGLKGGNRVLLPFGGRSVLYLDQVPALGSLDAPHVICHYFDYTDPQSQASYTALRDARERYGDQIVVLALAWPLDSTLNPHVPAEVAAKHPGAGDYARLAYAVWKAAPQQFEAFHDFLLTPRYAEQSGLTPLQVSIPSLEEARTVAEEMVGAEALERALADPYLDEQIRYIIEARDPMQGPKPDDAFYPKTEWMRYREEDGTYESRGLIGTLSSGWFFESLENFVGVEPLQTQVGEDDSIMDILNGRR